MNNAELLKIPECEKIGIYAIRNTKNNRMYIGSSKNIKQRTQQHRRMLLDFHGCNNKMREDIRKKSDLKNIEFIVLKTFESGTITDDQLAILEKEYQKNYDTINSGYNYDVSKHSGRREGKKILITDDKEKITVCLPKGSLKWIENNIDIPVNQFINELFQKYKQETQTDTETEYDIEYPFS